MNLITGFIATDEGVLERIAHRVANHRRGMKRRVLRLQLDFDDLLALSRAPPAFAMKMAW